MMTDTKKIVMTYTEAVAFARTHGLRQREVPVQYATSFLLPTMRFGKPSYAYFASPAERYPGRPMRQGAPDRWAVIDAHGGQLIIYALVSAVPFSSEKFTTHELPTPPESVAQLRQRIDTMEQLMERVAARWFAGEPVDSKQRADLSAELTALISPPLAGQYEALAPDFFSWLRS